MSGDSGQFLTCFTCFEQGHEAQDCKEDRADFKLVAPMAAFIGARLNYVLPVCNSGKHGGKLVSTIRVDQSKEKFWYARVYCELADDGLVTDKWLVEHEREVDCEAPTPEFRAKCFKRDAFHYRQVYLDMMKLVPVRLHKRIRDAADYHELLFDNVVEVDAWVDTLACLASDTFDPARVWCDRYGVKTYGELKVALGQFYVQPSLNDWIGDA